MEPGAFPAQGCPHPRNRGDERPAGEVRQRRAYIAAGGTIIRELFGDEDEGYLSDRALVTRLATTMLESAVANVEAEGWKWIKPELTRDHNLYYERLWPVTSDDADEIEEDSDAEDDRDEGQGAFSADDKARVGAITVAFSARRRVAHSLTTREDPRKP